MMPSHRLLRHVTGASAFRPKADRRATSDPATVASQVEKARTRFGIARIALVGDRGMITTARVRADLEPAGLAWISALKTTDLRKLAGVPAGGAPALVPDAVAEISSPDFPGERLMVCLNPHLRAERRRKREELLQATERVLERILENNTCARKSI